MPYISVLGALNELVDGWVKTRDALRLVPAGHKDADLLEGRQHAYIAALENYDDLAATVGETELETHLGELIEKCEMAPTGYTDYGRGYKLGMTECADDLRTMMRGIFA